jgi:salicylate hydroxylase
LYELACEAGVTFNFNSKVTKVDPHQATVVLDSGSKLSGDIVIGADGYRSVVRSFISGSNSGSIPELAVETWLSLRRVQNPVKFERHVLSSYDSLTIPTAVMRQHEEFVYLTEEAHVSCLHHAGSILITFSQWNFWFGDNCGLIGYLIVSAVISRLTVPNLSVPAGR